MFVIEFGPVAVFFATYYVTDFMTAALALGLSTLVALVLSKIVNRRLPWFALFSGTATILTALGTYLFTAPWVLIVADSVYYFLFAAILGVSAWRGWEVFKSFFGHVFAIAEEGWRSLERRWLLFFILAGVSNELVRIYLTTDEWVLYKQAIVFVFLFFGLYQFKVSRAHRLAEADAWGLRKLAGKE